MAIIKKIRGAVVATTTVPTVTPAAVRAVMARRFPAFADFCDRWEFDNM